ncbi:hypothetical protein [Erinnyis ello granulovirus]|nr:hypothetical protein [Erinnyis ello granulovirus]AIS92100.1 hypothetical protein [Erinnyis ello granulovirus]ARX71701.1 hypothetical protein EREL_102 [Erinnyis ello granulovirus]ARX71831.1 hypothetical protein EREL_102 [Erinnyis ello granulovirus]ARX71961.1 hypothetical protein EREL_102 [Erinnyis ello granulovirus]ARX72091.1 hypothetical protein EREL_102 [Erinnyis ello granulovirus]
MTLLVATIVINLIIYILYHKNHTCKYKRGVQYNVCYFVNCRIGVVLLHSAPVQK